MNKREIRAILTITSLAFGIDLMAQEVPKSKGKVVSRSVETARQPVKRSPDSLAEHAMLISMGATRELLAATKAKVRVRTKPKPTQTASLAINVTEPASVAQSISTDSIVADIDKLIAVHLKT